MADDRFDLQRFVDAQNEGGTYAGALRELRDGRKRTHWMWFVFPQIAGLGNSPMARHYAVSGLSEAQAYLAHEVLGSRLVESAEALIALDCANPVDVFGGIDAMKLRSSMTLFARAAPDQPVFRRVLEQYFDGDEDENTVARL